MMCLLVMNMSEYNCLAEEDSVNYSRCTTQNTTEKYLVLESAAVVVVPHPAV